MTAATRWPAEWEPQAGILLAWPHSGTDWAANLAAVEGCYRELIHSILGFEDVFEQLAGGVIAGALAVGNRRLEIGNTLHLQL